MLSKTRYYSDNHIVLIKSINFWNVYCKIIYRSRSFHKWKIFLIWVGEVIFLNLSKKSMIFVLKMITQNIFKIKKNFHSMKKFKISAFKQYKIFHSDSRNYKDMVKTTKVAERGGIFFVPNCILFCNKVFKNKCLW